MIKDEDCHGDWFACSFKEPVAKTTIKVSGKYVTPDGVARDVEAEANANVSAPILIVDSFDTGVTQLSSSAMEVKAEDSVEWLAVVETPQEFSDAMGDGWFSFAQTIVPNRTYVDAFGFVHPCLFNISAGVTYLDGPTPDYTSITVADGNFNDRFDDFPSQSFRGNRIDVADEFDLHLMFLPPGYGSQWVSLKNRTWGWGGTASLSSPFNWILTGGYCSSGGGGTYPWQPNWTEYLQL